MLRGASAFPWTGLASLVLVVCFGGCFGNRPEHDFPDSMGADTGGAAPWAPVAEGLRKGPWLGGPDPVSGKLRSGVTTYYRWVDVQAGKPVKAKLELRFETVSAGGATANLAVGDGAEWATPIPTLWRLKSGVPSHLTVDLVLPAGDSYLHITTSQQQRSSVKSLLLAPPKAEASADHTR